MDTDEIREAISQEDEVNHINDVLDYLYEIQHNIKVEERKELKTKRKELNAAVTSNV